MTTDQLRLPAPRTWRPLNLQDGTVSVLIGLPAAAALGAVAALHPEWWRALLAAAITINLVVVAMKWPRAAVVATLLWLPFLAFIRRILIDEAGWTQNDPLLLVGPLAALFLCYRLFIIERRELAQDRLSKLVAFLLLIAFVGAFNPFGGGGVFGGLAGVIYIGVPLLWFFIGRELGTRRLVTVVLYSVAVIAVGVAAYGLFQTEYGHMPQWDLDWYEITGYAGALAGKTESGDLLYRPWATFSSNSEYSGYLSFALIIALAMLFHRKPVLAVGIPVFALGIVLAGGRSIVALTLLTGVVLTALRSRNRLIALVVVVAGIGAVYGVGLAFGDRIDRAANVSGSATVERQAGGLLNPLDPNQSTFLGHWDNLVNAVETGVSNPVGRGTGASNIGARVSGEGGVETDIDIGDAFVSFGLIGGVLFIVIIVLSFKGVFGRYMRSSPPDPLLFAVAGLLVVNFGQWLQGGHYATSALMWFLLGWAVRPTADEVREESEDPLGLSAARSRLRRLYPRRA